MQEKEWLLLERESSRRWLLKQQVCWARESEYINREGGECVLLGRAIDTSPDRTDAVGTRARAAVHDRTQELVHNRQNQHGIAFVFVPSCTRKTYTHCRMKL
jgi:hypothetical protein